MTKCPGIKTSCRNTRIVNSVKKLINQLESDDITNFIPITKKEIEQTKKALDLYIKDCNTCAREGRSDYKCMQNAKTNLRRRIPLFAKNVYPWKNYDWDYGNYVSNNYAPRYTGATKKGSIRAMYNNVNAFIKLINGLVDDPIPNRYSIAGTVSRNSDYPPFTECTDPGCITAQRVKNSFTQKRPTNDSFLNKQINGEYASSYFVKIGSCPRHDIKNEKECEKRGYTWTPNIMDRVMKSNMKKKNAVNNNESGSCSQPRYGFLDNSPKPFINGSNMKGMVPAIANDFLALMPDKVLATAMGNSIADSFVVQQCPNTWESFNNYKKNNYNIIFTSILIIMIIFGIFYLQ